MSPPFCFFFFWILYFKTYRSITMNAGDEFEFESFVLARVCSI